LLVATQPQHPVILNALPELSVPAGIFTEFVIPESTFYDYQDGPTRSLNLELLNDEGQVEYLTNNLAVQN